MSTSRQWILPGTQFYDLIDGGTIISFTSATLTIKPYPYAVQGQTTGTWTRGYYIFYDLMIEYTGTDICGNDFIANFDLLDDEAWSVSTPPLTFICDGTPRTLTFSQSTPMGNTLELSNGRYNLLWSPFSLRYDSFIKILFDGGGRTRYNDLGVWSYTIPTSVAGPFSVAVTPTNGNALIVRILPQVNNLTGEITATGYNVESAFTIENDGPELTSGTLQLKFTVDGQQLSIANDFSSQTMPSSLSYWYMNSGGTAATGDWTVSDISLVIDT